MIAFRVSLNDGSAVTAGLREGVMSAHVTIRAVPEEDPADPARCWHDLGGLDSSSDEFLRWQEDEPLVPGDVWRIGVVEVSQVDPPRTRRPVNQPPPGWDESAEDEEDEKRESAAWREKMGKIVEVYQRPGEFQFSTTEAPLLALAVQINGGEIVIATVPSGVVTAIASFQSPAMNEGAGTWTCHFSLGGLDSNLRRQFHWLQRDLLPGDVIIIQVVKAIDANAPVERDAFTPAVRHSPST